MSVIVNDRRIDNSCPWSGHCFADGYCEGTCPETHYDILLASARLEHELGLTPHIDPDLQSVCATCRADGVSDE